MKKQVIGLLVILFLLSACGLSPAEQAILTSTSITPTSAAWTKTPVAPPTSTQIPSPTFTLTPTVTFTPTITAAPAFAFPSVTVNKQAHCRYGPAVAYLHAADLAVGDAGTVRERAVYSNWLRIKFDKLEYQCWVAPSVVDLVGDISNIIKTVPNLQTIGSNQYGPPHNVTAVRNGDQVTINWEQMVMSVDKDRGYFIEVFVCQNGFLLWWTFSYPDQYSTSYTVKDESGCSAPSYGQLYTVEKHGYSQPFDIPWPAP